MNKATYKRKWSRLSQTARKFLRLKMHLGKTDDEIADELKTTPEEVRRIIAEALGQLCTP